jgi:hypothetical protein
LCGVFPGRGAQKPHTMEMYNAALPKAKKRQLRKSQVYLSWPLVRLDGS